MGEFSKNQKFYMKVQIHKKNRWVDMVRTGKKCSDSDNIIYWVDMSINKFCINVVTYTAMDIRYHTVT